MFQSTNLVSQQIDEFLKTMNIIDDIWLSDSTKANKLYVKSIKLFEKISLISQNKLMIVYEVLKKSNKKYKLVTFLAWYISTYEPFYGKKLYLIYSYDPLVSLILDDRDSLHEQRTIKYKEQLEEYKIWKKNNQEEFEQTIKEFLDLPL